MKIFIIGDWKWDNYEPAFARALTRLGHEVCRGKGSTAFSSFLGKVESALTFLGPLTLRLNFRLLTSFKAANPDVVLLWRATQINPIVVKLMSKHSLVTTYTFDYPFGARLSGITPWHHVFLWRWYRKSLKHAHLNIFNRGQNLEDAPRYGSTSNARMLPYFVPDRDRPLHLDHSELDRFDAQVVFVGHFERDGRDDLLMGLVEAGIRVKIWGTGWHLSDNKELHSHFGDIVPVHGDDYARAISGSEIALCFLSRLNQDTYTQRCFEIPAIGSLLLSERTDDLKEMFQENEEACFFSSKSELLEKTQWLLDNPQIISRIAQSGRERVWTDRHHVKGRAEDFLKLIEKIEKQKSDGRGER